MWSDDGKYVLYNFIDASGANDEVEDRLIGEFSE
jgi:hypothetical protein